MYDKENNIKIEKPQRRKLNFKEWFFILIWLIWGLGFCIYCIDEDTGIVPFVYIIIGGSLSAFFYYIAVIKEYNKELEEYYKKVNYQKFIEQTDKTIFNNIPITNNENQRDIYSDTELSDFQKQLNSNTKTPEQVLNKKIIEEKKYILQQVERDYQNIKNSLLENVKNGNYISIKKSKQTSINFESEYLLSCIKREYSSNPIGKPGSKYYSTNAQLKYYIYKRDQYRFYLSMLKKYAQKDNIFISEYFVSVTSQKHEDKIMLPYIYKTEYGTLYHKIKIYLHCSIIY